MVIYYIATSNYKIGFLHFKKNLSFFYPNKEKVVVIISDGLDEWSGKIEGNIRFVVRKINHYPWPIITLFKMKLILDFWVDSDYSFYFNGNLQYNPDYILPGLLDLEKLNVSRHTFSDPEVKFDGKKFENISPSSLAYINEPYTYIHGGFFGGPSEIVKKMCKDVSWMVEEDLKKNIIPQWHDESYLNRWCVSNSDLVTPKKRLFSYQEFSPEYPFAIIETIPKDRIYGKVIYS